MGALWSTLGALLLAATVADLVLTVFQPSMRGPISKRVNRAVWSALRAVCRDGRARTLSFGGPVAVLADVALWVGGVLIGFALLYLPALDAFSFSPAVPFGSHGAVEALYLSGLVTFTIGFGDVVGATDAARLATIAQGAAGAGIVSAAITYVLSVYPIVTEQRATARRISDLQLDDPSGCSALLREVGLGPVERLHDSLLRNRQHLERFPVLYYFHATSEEESIYTLVRAAATTCAVLRWATDPETVPGAPRYADAIDATLQRTIDEYITGYVRGLSRRSGSRDLAEARDQLQALRRVAGHDGPLSQEALDEFASWLAPVDHFLDLLARAYKYPPRRLLAVGAPDTSRAR